MIAYVRWGVVLGLVSVALAGAWAAEAAIEPGPKGAEFDRLFTEWKGGLDQLYRLRNQYRLPLLENRELLPPRYSELLNQSKQMLAALTLAAEAAYLENPATDARATEFLVNTIYYLDFRDDSYEEALRVVKMLVDHGFDRRGPAIHAWAGIAAFASNEFELAEPWLRSAKENNLFARCDLPWREIGPAALKACHSCQREWEFEQAIRGVEAKGEQSPETWLPRVLLRTTKGEIEIELFENEAPNTVANFVALVEGGFYNADPARPQETAIPFYSVARAQTADTGGFVAPDGKVYSMLLAGCDPPRRAHFRGSVTMTAPADGHGGGTGQFSILLFPLQSLNGKNTCFGRVVRGMEVLSKLQRITPEQFDVLEPDRILEAKVLRKRNHAYELREPPEAKPKGDAAKPGNGAGTAAEAGN